MSSSNLCSLPIRLWLRHAHARQQIGYFLFMISNFRNVTLLQMCAPTGGNKSLDKVEVIVRDQIANRCWSWDSHSGLPDCKAYPLSAPAHCLENRVLPLFLTRDTGVRHPPFSRKTLEGLRRTPLSEPILVSLFWDSKYLRHIPLTSIQGQGRHN